MEDNSFTLERKQTQVRRSLPSSKDGLLFTMIQLEDFQIYNGVKTIYIHLVGAIFQTLVWIFSSASDVWYVILP